jgi:Immunity protein 15
VVTRGATVELDPRFRDEFERLFELSDLTNLDGLMTYHGYFDELPLFATYADISFLDDLPPDERNRVLIRAAVAYLGRILEHSRTYYAGGSYDYFCAVTVTNWEFVPDGDPVIPRFWYANPSHGVFEYLALDPPSSEESRFVAECLDHSPDYVLNDDVVNDYDETRLERVFVQHVSCPRPVTGQEQAPR